MCLSQFQIKIIKQEILSLFGVTTKVILFGSKVNDNAKGGDIDLMIRSE